MLLSNINRTLHVKTSSVHFTCNLGLQLRCGEILSKATLGKCGGVDCVYLSPKKGFQTIQTTDTILQLCKELVENDMNYFSSMISKNDLGKIISIASKEATDIAKAEKFLILIQN